MSEITSAYIAAGKIKSYVYSLSGLAACVIYNVRQKVNTSV